MKIITATGGGTVHRTRRTILKINMTYKKNNIPEKY